jgi:hypothetical protein
MKLLLTTLSKDQYHIEIADLANLTAVERLQMFVGHFKVSGWYQVSDDEIITFQSIASIKMEAEHGIRTKATNAVRKYA